MTYIEKNCESCGKVFQAKLKYHNQGQAKYCSKDCSHSGRKKDIPTKICQQCGKTFQSNNQFCSQQCANTFLSHQDRVSKNFKISESLTVYDSEVKLICKNCNQYFYVDPKHRRRKTCSDLCKKELHRTPEARKNHSLAAIKRISSSLNLDRLKSIVCYYTFNNKLIRCDSKAEFSCLNYIENNFNVVSMDRCSLILEYELNGIIRRYNPDFEINLDDGSSIIVECKTVLSNKDLQRKWKIYYLSIEPKRKALISYCENNGYKYLFYNKDMNLNYYNSISRQQLQSAVSPEVKTPV